MTQKEIKNKTKLYTIAAVLSALILVGTIYAATPTIIMHGTLELSQMKPFNSIEDLRNYLTKNTVETTAEGVYITDTGFLGRGFLGSSSDYVPMPVPSAAAYTLIDGEASLSASFSSTNIQVAGVDEADIVKTDGKYIYTLRSTYGYNVQIVSADAKNPVVVGKIDLDNYASGMYLSKDGNKLVILGNSYNMYPVPLPIPLNGIVSDTSKPQQTSEPSITLQYSQYYRSQAFIYVYDVSNKVTPVLTRNVTLSGNYVNSRMIDNYVYLAVNQQAYADDEIVILPRISVNGVTKEVAPTSIYYTDMQDTSFSYTLFNSINIMNDNEQPTSMTILMSASSCMYVSINNMYVTFNKYENTELYRMAFNGANLNFEAEGTVPGYVLNQYSMDEYNDYFRIATTVSTGPWDNRVEYNNLYILNMNLDTVGKIENLANGERIYSARFAGDKAYLVTFEQVDPFFVLDLKNPTSPQVIGELKIPGFSNYLHPYNENYIIGLGREDNSVKLSLFDVTDMSNPVEVAKYTISENIAELYSYSAASNEPKAFLFDPQKQLLVIPVTANYYKSWPIEPTPITLEQGSTDNSGILADLDISAGMWQSGSWSGAYVFNVSTENGFTLQKAISHKPVGSDSWNYAVTRSMYIDITLYTISNDMIQLNSLDDFSLIAQVVF